MQERAALDALGLFSQPHFWGSPDLRLRSPGRAENVPSRSPPGPSLGPHLLPVSPGGGGGGAGGALCPSPEMVSSAAFGPSSALPRRPGTVRHPQPDPPPATPTHVPPRWHLSPALQLSPSQTPADSCSGRPGLSRAGQRHAARPPSPSTAGTLFLPAPVRRADSPSWSSGPSSLCPRPGPSAPLTGTEVRPCFCCCAANSQPAPRRGMKQQPAVPSGSAAQESGPAAVRLCTGRGRFQVHGPHRRPWDSLLSCGHEILQVCTQQPELTLILQMALEWLKCCRISSPCPGITPVSPLSCCLAESPCERRMLSGFKDAKMFKKKKKTKKTSMSRNW